MSSVITSRAFHSDYLRLKEENKLLQRRVVEYKDTVGKLEGELKDIHNRYDDLADRYDELRIATF